MYITSKISGHAMTKRVAIDPICIMKAQYCQTADRCCTFIREPEVDYSISSLWLMTIVITSIMVTWPKTLIKIFAVSENIVATFIVVRCLHITLQSAIFFIRDDCLLNGPIQKLYRTSNAVFETMPRVRFVIIRASTLNTFPVSFLFWRLKMNLRVIGNVNK